MQTIFGVWGTPKLFKNNLETSNQSKIDQKPRPISKRFTIVKFPQIVLGNQVKVD